jgi:hypothetical protein
MRKISEFTIATALLVTLFASTTYAQGIYPGVSWADGTACELRLEKQNAEVQFSKSKFRFGGQIQRGYFYVQVDNLFDKEQNSLRTQHQIMKPFTEKFGIGDDSWYSLLGRSLAPLLPWADTLTIGLSDEDNQPAIAVYSSRQPTRQRFDICILK